MKRFTLLDCFSFICTLRQQPKKERQKVTDRERETGSKRMKEWVMGSKQWITFYWITGIFPYTDCEQNAWSQQWQSTRELLGVSGHSNNRQQLLILLVLISDKPCACLQLCQINSIEKPYLSMFSPTLHIKRIKRAFLRSLSSIFHYKPGVYEFHVTNQAHKNIAFTRNLVSFSNTETLTCDHKLSEQVDRFVPDSRMYGRNTAS